MTFRVQFHIEFLDEKGSFAAVCKYDKQMASMIKADTEGYIIRRSSSLIDLGLRFFQLMDIFCVFPRTIYPDM